METYVHTPAQQSARLMPYPSGRWMRLLAKAPLVLWRLGLGPLLGRALLVITHTGRKSGLPRHTMTEYHWMADVIYVPCAFGPRAQWYRNIEADPVVTIQTDGGAQAMVGRRVTDDEELLAVYTLIDQRNPLMLGRYLQSLDIPNTAEDVLRHKDRVHILAFEPTDLPAPPPLAVDLVWVWGVLGVVAALRWLRRTRRCQPATQD